MLTSSPSALTSRPHFPPRVGDRSLEPCLSDLDSYCEAVLPWTVRSLPSWVHRKFACESERGHCWARSPGHVEGLAGWHKLHPSSSFQQLPHEGLECDCHVILGCLRRECCLLVLVGRVSLTRTSPPCFPHALNTHPPCTFSTLTLQLYTLIH